MGNRPFGYSLDGEQLTSAENNKSGKGHNNTINIFFTICWQQ